MSSSQSINALIGAATRFIASRNAVQTVYWRSSSNGTKMIKYKKTCTFDRSEKMPRSLQDHFTNPDLIPTPK